MDLYTIDFETYYAKDYSLGKMTTQGYIQGDQFQIIGVAVAKNSEPPCWVSSSNIKDYADFLAPLHNQVVLAHNAPFDMGILSLIFGIIPKVILDTLAMSKPLHGLTVGGSLKALAEKYSIGIKGTEVVTALGKRLEDFTPEELAAYGKYCENDVVLTRTLFGKLKKYTNDLELKVIDGTVRMATEPTLILDTDMLLKSLDAERGAKRRLLIECGVPRETLMSNPKFALALEELGIDPPMKVSVQTGKEAFAFAKSDKMFTALLDHPDPSVSKLVEARLAMKSTLNETRMEKLIDLSHYGPLCVPLQYCGAVTTWRWSGYDGLNLQNLPSRGDNTIRRAITAPVGYKLVVADSSNIELRCNHALAGQQDTIDKLRRGEDLYKDFASTLYNVLVSEVTKEQRFVGKVAHLSLGYACGWAKFKEMVRIYGGELTDDEAENIVRTWRSTYTAVTRCWKNADKLIKGMATGVSYSLESAPFIRSKKGVLLTPPSHHIQYPMLGRGDDGYEYRSRRGRGTETVKLYGGKLVENLCQHLSRNILAEQFVTINKRYPVAMMVHDEFICAVPEDEATEALAWIIDVMSTSPEWWPEIPLAAEGDIADRYGDAK